MSAARALVAAALMSPVGTSEDAVARTHGFVMSLWRMWDRKLEPTNASDAAGGSSGCEPAAIAVGRDCTPARSLSSSVPQPERDGCEGNVESVSCLEGVVGSGNSFNERRLQDLASRVESRAIRHRPDDAPRRDSNLVCMRTDVTLHLLDLAATGANNSYAPEEEDLRETLTATQESLTVGEPNPQRASRAIVVSRAWEVAYVQLLEALVLSLTMGSLDIMRENRSYRKRLDSLLRD